VFITNCSPTVASNKNKTSTADQCLCKNSYRYCKNLLYVVYYVKKQTPVTL